LALLLPLLRIGGLLLLSTRGCPVQRNGAQRSEQNVFQSAHHFHYGTTIVSPAFNWMSCSAFLPLIASL